MTLKKKEIVGIVDEYQELLPGWKRWDWGSVYRNTGPLMQCLIFDRSSGDDYRTRPCFKSLLAVRVIDYVGTGWNTIVEQPDDSVLGHCSESSIRLKFHDFYKPRLIAKLRKNLVPSPLEPFDLMLAVAHCKQQCPPKPSDRDASWLAALAAYVGDIEVAREYCRNALADQYSIAMDASIAAHRPVELHDAQWYEGDRPFMRHLLRWLDDGSYMARFEVMIREARERYGIVATD